MLPIILFSLLGVMLLVLGYSMFYINSKMSSDELSIEEYFLVVKSTWAKIFSLLFTIVEDDGEATIIALTNIPPYLMGLIAELPIDVKRGDHEGQPVLFVRSKFLKEVLERIQSSARQIGDSPRLYQIQSVRPESLTVRWTNFMYQFWRGLRLSHISPDQLLKLRQEYQEAIKHHIVALKSVLILQAEDLDAKDQYEVWASKLYGELASHPDILRVSLTEIPGTIVIYTDDIIVEETGTKVKRDAQGIKKPHFWRLGKMRIYIDLKTHDTSYMHEDGHMPGDTSRQAPHVQGHACWGTHKDVIASALRQRNYMKAIQEAINFVQYANTADGWGNTAFLLPELSKESVTEIQNRKLLRVEGASFASSPQKVSPTSFYVIKDTKAHRKVLKQLGIEIALVLQGNEGYGVEGLLIEGADINAFINAVIETGKTIRTDATAQNNVRQLLFVPDKEKEQFVKLLVDAWKTNKPKLPTHAWDELQEQQRNLNNARMGYLKALLSQSKQSLSISDEILDTGIMTGVYEEQLRSLLAIPEVESVEVGDQQITITTVDLQLHHQPEQASRAVHYQLGKLTIVLDFHLENPIRIYRNGGKISQHIMSPNLVGDGVPLWGVKELQLLQFFAKGQWAQLVSECIQYVSTLKDKEMTKYLAYMQPTQAIDLEAFKQAREKEIQQRLENLPSLLRPKQAQELTVEQLLNQ